MARAAQQKARRQAERQLELQWRLANLAVAPEQPEPLQAARCWMQVSLQERRARLK
ncbi:MAG TPA: hypothetical protein VGS58_03825 [Candidatus Sulfopaludibacter sp.]|nr:hypothetical protein [Candidatus Sulfopaludibacter sp.]